MQREETEKTGSVLGLKQSLGLSAAWGRTIRQYGHRATANTQKRARLSDCPRVTGGLSANRESARTERPKITSNQKSPNLWPNQNQLPPNFNHMVTRQ
jgi:hypothetical protein